MAGGNGGLEGSEQPVLAVRRRDVSHPGLIDIGTGA
jgi:hypothetical protein